MTWQRRTLTCQRRGLGTEGIVPTDCQIELVDDYTDRIGIGIGIGIVSPVPYPTKHSPRANLLLPILISSFAFWKIFPPTQRPGPMFFLISPSNGPDMGHSQFPFSISLPIGRRCGKWLRKEKPHSPPNQSNNKRVFLCYCVFRIRRERERERAYQSLSQNVDEFFQKLINPEFSMPNPNVRLLSFWFNFHLALLTFDLPPYFSNYWIWSVYAFVTQEVEAQLHRYNYKGPC